MEQAFSVVPGSRARPVASVRVCPRRPRDGVAQPCRPAPPARGVVRLPAVWQRVNVLKGGAPGPGRRERLPSSHADRGLSAHGVCCERTRCTAQCPSGHAEPPVRLARPGSTGGPPLPRSREIDARLPDCPTPSHQHGKGLPHAQNRQVGVARLHDDSGYARLASPPAAADASSSRQALETLTCTSTSTTVYDPPITRRHHHEHPNHRPDLRPLRGHR